MLKLYKIELKGVKSGELAKNSSPGTTYVIAPTMDSAHMALINAYRTSGTLDVNSLEIDNLEIIASEDTNINTPNFYKLAVLGNIVYNNDENHIKEETKNNVNKKRGRKPKNNKDNTEENNEKENEQ